MCIYIGIEDLVANAMIELIENDKKQEVLFKDLSKYGAKVVKILMKNDKKAVLIFSKESTVEFMNDYSDYFEMFQNDSHDEGVRLKNGVSINDLWDKFRGYLSVDVMMAFSNRESVKILGV